MAGLGSVGVMKIAAVGMTGLLVVGGGSAVYFGAGDPMGAALAPEPDAERVVETAMAPPDVSAPLEPVQPLAVEDIRQFDVVRVEPDGMAVVAGRGVAGEPLILALDGETIASVTPDQGGQFVQILSLPPSNAPRLLELQWQNEDGQSDVAPEAVIVGATVGAGIQAAKAVASPRRDLGPPASAPLRDAINAAQTQVRSPVSVGQTIEGTGIALGQAPGGIKPPTDLAASDPVALAAPNAQHRGVGEVGQSAPEPVAVAATPAPTPAPTPVRPDVFAASSTGVTQLVPRALPQPSQVAIDNVSYGTDGEVLVQGRSGSLGRVQVRLDDVVVGDPVTLGEAGPWQVTLQDVVPGQYVLAADLTQDGDLVARAQTPFLRADIAESQDIGAGVDVVTVQPGYSLWRIAREQYGSGVQYVQVFEANRDQIRNPDLIFPGQILSVPQ